MNQQNQIDGVPLQEPLKQKRKYNKSGKYSKKGAPTFSGDDAKDFRSEEGKYQDIENVIEKGPYTTKAARWDAYRKVLDLQTVREYEGKSRIKEGRIAEHIGCSYAEFEREVFSTAFQNFRIAKASMQIMATLADVAPTLRLSLLRLSEQIKTPGTDLKKEKDFISLISDVMQRFGIQKVDISHADSSQELDTDEAIKEGMRILQEMKGHEEIVQWFTKTATESRGNKGKAIETGDDSGTSKDSPANGPGTALASI